MLILEISLGKTEKKRGDGQVMIPAILGR